MLDDVWFSDDDDDSDDYKHFPVKILVLVLLVSKAMS